MSYKLELEFRIVPDLVSAQTLRPTTNRNTASCHPSTVGWRPSLESLRDLTLGDSETFESFVLDVTRLVTVITSSIACFHACFNMLGSHQGRSYPSRTLLPNQIEVCLHTNGDRLCCSFDKELANAIDVCTFS